MRRVATFASLAIALVALVALGCSHESRPPPAQKTIGQDGPPPAPPGPRDPTPDGPTPGTFPALETACTTDADCTTTGRYSECCGACELRYASTAYVAKVEQYCKAHPPPSCPPMGCSWGMEAVACVDGACKAGSARKPTPHH